jgi:uncharacterized membrane protein (UPF0182 family)
MVPNYYIMRLPGENQVEFVNSIPYTPNGKDNMTALLVARNDGAHYGELVLFQLPKGRIVMGPNQIDAQIAQDTDISKDFSLWENSGSTYSRGNMFVVPIEDSIMYVETIYLKASSSSMPEVKRIILYYNDRIAYEQTLAEALDSMFGKGAGAAATKVGGEDVDQETPDDDTSASAGGSGSSGGSGGSGGTDTSALSDAELIVAAQAAYEDGQQALKDGDWAAYGKAQEELGRILAQLAGPSAHPAAPIEEPADAAAADDDTAASGDEAANTEE